MRRNPFIKNPERSNLTRVNGMRVLEWLAKQPGMATSTANRSIAAAIGIPLDTKRAQSRRLSEALEALRNADLIEVTYEAPHPKESPVGRRIKLTAKGASLIGQAP